jgi:hypothetical protein
MSTYGILGVGPQSKSDGDDPLEFEVEHLGQLVSRRVFVSGGVLLRKVEHIVQHVHEVGGGGSFPRW